MTASLQAATLDNALISEFLTSNGDGIVDSGGDRSDWLEIRNTSGTAGDLGGWFLTDDPTDLNKWTLPTVSLTNGGYLVVFASGKDLAALPGELHTNFKLQAGQGGYLALVKPDGTTIATEFVDYPQQFTDISYGEGDKFYPEPTPGEANGSGVNGITLDTRFDHKRGVYDASFDLAITSETPDATIRFTTNGAAPTETSGMIYGGPVAISETTIVRAIAYKAGFRSTNVDTHTFLFPADVVDQPTMRTAITQDATFGPQMIDSLNSLPSISLTFSGSDVGYNEIPTSVELLNFEGGSKQVYAGTARFGGAFTNFTKRSIRLHFRSEYGPSRLKFPLFDGFEYPIPPVENFDALDLRAGNHDMVARGAYLSNRFTDDSTLEMGQIAPHGRFVHLYFNGLYRGQYHLRERWDAAMLSSYLPGKEEEYDTINANNSGSEFLTGESQDGDLTDWNQVRVLLNGGTPYSKVKDLLDVGNLIDFMLLWTAGDAESEFRAGGSPANGVGFKFMIKDADGFLRGTNYSVNHNGPLNAMTRLRLEGDPDYKILLADHIHRHFFNDGAMTGPKLVGRLQKRVDEVSLSYLSEIARWGNHNGQTNRTPQSWLAFQNNLLTRTLPNLTASQLAKFRSAGMYPDLIAPVFSQHGGDIPAGGGITMTTGETTIYYTLDGSDPRLSGGGTAPGAISAPFAGDVPVPTDYVVSGDVWNYLDDGSDQGTAWRAAGFDDSAWASGPSQLGYLEGDEMTVTGFVDIDPVTPGNQRNATTYFRTKVTIPEPSKFSFFSLKLLYDDGAAVYLNGNEIVRTDTLAPNAAFDDYALAGTPDENEFFEFIIPTSVFSAGENTLAVEIHNQSSGSSDISFDLTLRGEIDTSAGANLTQPVLLTESGIVNARSYNPSSKNWSALSSAFFNVDTVPASAANLVISEIHYHPAEPVTAAEIAISSNRDDYEFIELFNISGQTIDLTGVHFSTGIDFAFSEHTLLAPGARVVLVKDPEAFVVRYGAGVLIGGEYSGNLSNKEDLLTLSLTGSGDLRSVSYTDEAPWPTLPDGSGYSMVLRIPMSNPDSTMGGNWGTHAVLGGGPGVADTLQSQSAGFEDWKTANNVGSDEEDIDSDGLSALLEYALGTDPSAADPGAVRGAGIMEGYATITYQKNPQRTDVIFQLQSSEDLFDWQNEASTEVAPDVYRIDTLVEDGAKRFLRLKVILN